MTRLTAGGLNQKVFGGRNGDKTRLAMQNYRDDPAYHDHFHGDHPAYGEHQAYGEEHLYQEAPPEPERPKAQPKHSRPVEWALLTGFKWATLGLSVTAGLAMIAVLILTLVEGLSGGSARTGNLDGLTLDHYVDTRAGSAPAIATNGIPASVQLSGPVFTDVPEEARQRAYQALYDRALQIGQRFEILKEPDALVKTVNGALKEFDRADHPSDGTYAYVFLTKLNMLADELALNRNRTLPGGAALPGLEEVAVWLTDDVRLAMRAQAPTGGFARPSLNDRLQLAFWLGATFLLGIAVWGLLAFIAQGRTYWIVQNGG